MIAVLIGIVLLAPLSATIAANTGTVSVTDETASADVGSYVELGGYDAVADSETVEYYNSTTDSYETATAGTDYEFVDRNASVKALSGGEIPDGAELRVDYEYQASDPTTSTIVGLVPTLAAVMALAVMGERLRRQS